MTSRGGEALAISAAELASLRIEGLPTTKRGINIRRDRDGWRAAGRGGRGGAELIDVASLPDDLREKIVARLEARKRRIPTAANDIRRGRGRPKGTDFFTAHPDVADAVEAYLTQRSLSASVVLDLLRTEFAEVPHLRALQRFIKAFEASKPALLASFVDPDAYKSKFRVALGDADGAETHANQVWELDATKADVMTTDGRKMILGVIDRWSRRCRFMVADSESGQAVRRLLIETIRAWGVMPETVVTDQGSGFICASIVSACEALDIEHRPCPPASGDRKPFIERVFGTFTRDRAEILPGYIGHNVAEAQRLRAVARANTGKPVIQATISAVDLQSILHAWVEGAYIHRRHSKLGMSPLARWQSSPVPSAAAPAENTLRIALSKQEGPMMVTKRGVRWRNGRYWSAALAPWIGRMVQVRRDEEDLGALFVFDEDGRFIDTAVNAMRSGLSQQAFAAAAKANQAAHMKEVRAVIREKQRRFSFDKARDALLRQEAEAAGKLVALPRPTVERSTPQIDSFQTAHAPVPITSAPKASAPQSTAAVSERAARAERLIADHDAGHEVDAQQLAWARAFVAGPTYAAHRARQQIFGADAPANINLRS